MLSWRASATDPRWLAGVVPPSLRVVVAGLEAWQWIGLLGGLALSYSFARLVSAADASKMWELRVDVREKLVTWLQTHEGGRFLPRLRLEGGSTAR